MEFQDRAQKTYDFSLSRTTQAAIGTYLDLKGVDCYGLGDGDLSPANPEIEELSLLFWAPKISRAGLGARAHISATPDDIRQVSGVMLDADKKWWVHMEPALVELGKAYEQATGEKLLNLVMLPSREYNLSQN